MDMSWFLRSSRGCGGLYYPGFGSRKLFFTGDWEGMSYNSNRIQTCIKANIYENSVYTFFYFV